MAARVLEHMREAHKREVEALQQSHTAELKHLEAASKTREDQWRAREAKLENRAQVCAGPAPESPKATDRDWGCGRC